MIKTVTGNILESDAQYICHQCNCIATGNGAGLSFAMFDKYPYANIYGDRTERDKLGTIDIRGNGEDQRYIINILAQYYPGSAVYPNDNPSIREAAFRECLCQISRIPNLVSIAFPYMIGCGLAGGNWDRYYQMIETFSENNPNVDVKVIQLPE